jgi:hypothetical protein
MAPDVAAARPKSEHVSAREGSKAEPSRAGRAPPRSALPPLLRLQRSAGNFAVQRALGIANQRTTEGATASRLATSLEHEADLAAFAFDRDAPLEAGAIRPGPLGPETRVPAERALGAPLGNVRIHTGARADAAAHGLAARAFALDADVVVGARGIADRAAERRLLAHELAHVVQQRAHGVAVQRSPDPPPPAPAPVASYPTLSQVLTDDGTAFRPGYEELQQRYAAYRQTSPKPAGPERWVKLARGSNREALLRILGPNLGEQIEPDDPDEADVLRLSDLTRPEGYTAEQERQDLELLRRYPGALDARLTSIPSQQLERGEIAGGYVRIASGTVGEALAEPVLQLRLAQLRQQYSDAQVFRNVRVRMPVGTNADGSVMLSPPLLFSDGIIGRITGSGLPGAGLQLQILYVQEVKSGARGGQEATEQTFRWIEGNIADGARIVLENGLEFEYDPTAPGGVRGLMSAPRGIVAGRGVAQLGAGSSMGIAAPVERVELARTPAQMRYLAGLLLQSIWAREQLRRLEQNERTAYEASSTAEFTDADVVQRILAEHNGLAVASGRLYELRSVAGELQISERPVVSLAFVYPPGTRVPGQTTALPPGPPAPPQVGPGAPSPTPAPPPPSLPPAPPSAPLQLGPGLGAQAEEPLPLLPALRPAAEIAQGAVPATALGEWLPRVGSIEGEWVIWDGRLRDTEGRPITGYQDGEIWVRVIRPGGTPLPEIDPATGSPAPIARALTPEGPVTFQATPYQAPGVRTPTAGTQAVAVGVGLIMVANEILAPIAATRDIQRQHNARRTAVIRFLTEFGANPRWAIEDMDKPSGAPLLPWQTEQDIGALWGHWRSPRIVALDVPAMLERLPGRLPDFASLVMFLGLGRSLGVIEQEGSRYYLVVRDVTNTDITETVERIRVERLRAVDERSRADMLARSGHGVYRIRSSGTTIYRYATSVREHRRLGSFESTVITAPEFLGANAWVREAGEQGGGSAGRLHVEPANAEAAAVAQNAWYIVHKEIDSVYEEVEGTGRAITSRQPPDGRLESFTAGPFPPELGPTRYIRHPDPDARNLYTIAIGQLLQFWVDRDDLEPITDDAASAYAHGTPAAPPPSHFFTSEERSDLPLI